MGASVRTIKANVPMFIPTKVSQPTFVFDKGNVKSDNKTVNEFNMQKNNSNNDNNYNVTDEDVLWNGNLKNS